jgi:HKD family nuclease
MRIVLNNSRGSTTFQEALRELTQGAETLSVAVSYLQVGGWELFREHVQSLSLPKMRILCTDQLGITHPEAVKRALASQVNVRNFTGAPVYHPKVFIAHNAHSRPIRFLLGSANLSTSAFSSSIEAGVLGDEVNGLRTLDRWFNNLFSRRSEAFTPELLRELERKWREGAEQRARNRLRVRRSLVEAAGTIPAEPEDVDTLEDVLATIQLPVGLLNLDYAGNNVRNIHKLREVLANPTEASSKQKSELKLLGFMQEGSLTTFGRLAVAARTNNDVARLWCQWLKQTPDEQLREINPKLMVAKRVFPQFWRLNEDVRDYFLENARNPQERKTSQTIELLCNASEVVQGLSLDDMRTLSPLLQSDRVPAYIRGHILEYFNNKGQRGWDTDDRRVFLLAWQEA